MIYRFSPKASSLFKTGAALMAGVVLFSGAAFGQIPDIAQGKPASASSIQDNNQPVYGPDKAVDGYPGTRWGSAWTTNEWLKVDLQAIYSITSVRIAWEAANAKEFKIELSNDNATWTEISHPMNGAAGARVDNLTVSGSGRYIRMTGIIRNMANNGLWGYSLYDFNVYGTLQAYVTWVGTLTTAPLSPKEGTAYHNSSNGKSFVYHSNAWEIMADLIAGPQGPQGDKGDQGDQGLTGATGPMGPAGPAGAGLNTMHIATLHWYSANTAFSSIPVGTAPSGMVFDGVNIWVANYYGNSVTKIAARTSTIIGTYPAGDKPGKIAFDGTNIWVSNHFANTVTELNGSTGAIIATYSVGTMPDGIAFDGANIWVANQQSDNVTKINAATGAIIATYGAGNGPVSLAFDGTNMWATNYSSPSTTVTKINAATGAIVGSYNVGDSPLGIAFDGTNMWITNGNGNTVVKVKTSTGDIIGTYSVGNSPDGIVFDGANIWTANYRGNSVTKLDAATGATLGTYSVGDNSHQIVFDGINIWISSYNLNSVSRL